MSLVAMALIVGGLPTLTGPCRTRAALRPGMSVAEVFEHSGGYFVCTLISKPEDPRAPRLQVFSLALVEGDNREAFANAADLGRGLEERMKRKPGPWIASFGYITMVPRRTYFSVEFGPDARVRSVSETWAGLD